MKVYRMCWKHEDLPTSSMGPVLRHHEDGRPYTKEEAEAICEKFNKGHLNIHYNKKEGNKVSHWIKEVNVKKEGNVNE